MFLTHIAFKVKTFRPNYEITPFERRCFDVSVLFYFFYSFLTRHFFNSILRVYDWKLENWKPLFWKEKEICVHFSFFSSYSPLTLRISVPQYSHTSLKLKRKMYFLLGWVCMSMKLNTLLYFVASRILSHQLLQECKIWLTNCEIKKNITTAY